MTSVHPVIKFLSLSKTCVEIEDETWTWIKVPRFRLTSFPKANQFISNKGRIMNNEGQILEATNDYLKVSIPTKGADENSPGHSTTYGLHVVVCYTFHGLPPTPQHTVDHINRHHWDNRASNLRWASHSEQLFNRDICRYNVLYNDKDYYSIKELAHDLGKQVSCVRGMIKQNDESIFQVTKRVRYQQSLPEPSPEDLPEKRQKIDNNKNKSDEAFNLFLAGNTIPEISDRTHLQQSTVSQYIIAGARNASQEIREKFKQRIGLDSFEAYNRLVDQVNLFRETKPTSTEWQTEGPNIYISPCNDRASPKLLPIEYKIVQSTYKTLWRDHEQHLPQGTTGGPSTGDAS